MPNPRWFPCFMSSCVVFDFLCVFTGLKCVTLSCYPAFVMEYICTQVRDKYLHQGTKKHVFYSILFYVLLSGNQKTALDLMYYRYIYYRRIQETKSEQTVEHHP